MQQAVHARRHRAEATSPILRSALAHVEISAENAIQPIQHRNRGGTARIIVDADAAHQSLRWRTGTVQRDYHELFVESANMLHTDELDAKTFADDCFQRGQRCRGSRALLEQVTALATHFTDFDFAVPFQRHTYFHVAAAFDDSLELGEFDTA